MARSKKVTPAPQVESLPPSSTKATSGFYKKNGNTLQFAPKAVHYPGGSLLASNPTEHTYPVEGWTYYESAEAAYASEGLPQPEPKVAETKVSLAERIAARRAMTVEEKEAERAQRNADRIARIEAINPQRAEQLKARVEERKVRRETMLARRAMTPEQRNAESLARLEQRNPELAAKVRSREAAKL